MPDDPSLETTVVLERFRLDDRVAIVTGAGRGIGAASALALAEAGCDVVLSARTEEQLREVAARVESLGRRAVVVAADLLDLDQTAGLAARATQELGRIDVVVNNVGGGMPRPFADTSTRAMDHVYKFNVLTAHALTKAALPALLASGEGSVINISSTMGRLSGRGYLAYGTAKAALAHWSRLAAKDLAPRVRVNAIAVGATATSALEQVTSDEAATRAIEAATPLRRIGDPDDVAATVLFLASRAGGYLTGKVLEVDGGIDAPNLDLGLPDLTDGVL